jgi:RNase P/RNase MRP subunit p29
VIIDEDALAHYGTPRHSGRYPWGSGGDENARNRGFMGMYNDLKSKGLSETEIAAAMGFSKYDKKTGELTSAGTTELRNRRTIALNAQKAADIAQAEKLKATGMSNAAIGREMGGINESSVRSLLAPGQKDKNAIISATQATIRDAVEEHGLVDIGAYVEQRMGVSRSKFDAAVSLLIEEGYQKHYLRIPQLGTSHETTFKVLAKKDMDWKEANRRRGEITQITPYSENGGSSYNPLKYPTPINPKRVSVKWAEEGGDQADGMIYIRPGAKDLSLGSASYAQVRINVGNSHFLKGMAMYKDDLPEGVDIEFHTSKQKVASKTGNKLDALKPLKKDLDGNPDFMKSIRRQRGALNIVQEEGEWEKWAGNLSSQMLSKQRPAFAKQQLDVYHERKKSQLDEIMSLTNPVVRKKLLEDFADGVDASAVDLEAAGLPRTANHVILPLSKIKPTEIYAPNFKQGERVALIRHPHGGLFEIPDLVVNNNNPAAKKAFGNLQDAVGIHHTVAEKLSGADFDGDTVLVIPNNRGQVKHEPTLEALKGFDAKRRYPSYEGMRTIDGGVITNGKAVYGPKGPNPATKQHEMGNVSNLITDMTIKGAGHEEIARAIKHSMVVIDAEKHELNYKQSEIDNGIRELKAKWQKDGSSRGAATIISRAGARLDVPERKQLVKTDPITGRKIYTNTNASFVGRDGKVVNRTTRTQKLADTEDAFTLVGKPAHQMEVIYAEHSNRLKAMANQARKEAYHTTGTPYSQSANKAYAKEVAALKSKLNLAQQAAPLERQAQVVGNSLLKARVDADPNMTPETKKKLKSQILEQARVRTGSKKTRIEITTDEWNAIQAGAITKGMLSNILDNANMEIVKKLATPKTPIKMTDSKTALATSLLARGYTQAEVAEQLGVSLTTLKVALKGD